MTRLILAVAFVLALPATATAQITVPQALQIAYAADPAAPCAGLVTIQWNPALTAEHLDGQAALVVQNGALRPYGCQITLNPALNREARDDGGRHRCDVIVHEVKHKAGYGHAASGVMKRTAGHWPPCHRGERKHHVHTRRHGNKFDSA
jgi:hypothetical protein